MQSIFNSIFINFLVKKCTETSQNLLGTVYHLKEQLWSA